MDARHTVYTTTGDSAVHTIFTPMEYRDDERKNDSVVASADGERNNTAIVVLDLLKFIEILPSGGFARKYVCNILTMLDIKSLGGFINTSFLKLFCRRTQNNYILLQRRCKEIQYPYKLQFFEKLKERYRKEFPRGTPLVCACEKGRMVNVKILIEIGGNEAGMDVTAMVRKRGKCSNGYSGWTPLMIAAENKQSTVAEYLVEIMYPNATALEKKYYLEFPKGIPFVCACEKGRVEDVEGMIRGARAAGMDVTAMVSEVGTHSGGGSGWTPLMVAAWYEHSTIIEILLQCNADTATTNNDGFNALHYAAWKNKTTTTTVQLLLNNMKLEDINHINTDNGYTPLDFCYKWNDSSIKQQLIDLIRQKGGKRQSEL
jgi:hypothetical protein